MTVPALDTSYIGTFAYIQPATSIQLADALPYFQAYQQYPEYVDGVMRIWDTGSESPAPNNYCDVYVRIRTDGWMMAFFPDDAHAPNGPPSHPWTLGNYTNRGDLLWWGHTSSATGNPTTNATRLGRALAELWEAVKANSDNPGYAFDYADVGYYDYEHTTSAKIYIFGRTDYGEHAITKNDYYYFTIPVGTNIQCAYANYGYSMLAYCADGYTAKGAFEINAGTAKEHVFFNYSLGTCDSVATNGYSPEDIISYVFTGGVQNELHIYLYMTGTSSHVKINTAIVILADG